MRRFAGLYQQLDRLTSTNERRAALVAYLADAPPADAAWAIWLLTGGKVSSAKNRIASPAELKQWLCEFAGTPEWLLADAHAHVGDLAETLALMLDDPQDAANDIPLSRWIENHLLAVAGADPEVRRERVIAAWRTLPFAERLVFNKLLTGALRIGVSQGLVQQALAERSGLDIALIAQRMLGKWTPSADFLPRLLDPARLPEDQQLPYPFYLASPLEEPAESLGPISDWQIEWKWDGIRAQLIRRGAQLAVWSRGEERMEGRFPEIEAALQALDTDVVLDGEILVWHDEAPLPAPFIDLQTRIQRRKPGPKMLAQRPVRFLAYDLLERDGEDLRARPLHERRALLEQLLADAPGSTLAIPPPVVVGTWSDAAALRETSRERGVEGFMLKRRDAPYRHGRKRGEWWKWKVDPLTVDAVLLYAQSGSGRRSTLYTDYTFGLWDGEALVPFAKAYSGLDDKEILKLDRWIRANTLERFGPVRSVKAQHVFEIGFEAVNRSSRHKSGIAVRFPRILRWREDKTVAEADHVEALRRLAR